MKRQRSRRARILGFTSLGVAVVLVAAVLTIYIGVQAKLDRITHIARIDVRHRPPKYDTSALNVLLLGSDTRAGANARIGGPVGCNCSDTIMLVHLSPGRKAATVISIPRDTMVPYYACSPWDGLPGQQADPYSVERINATLAAGGPECTRETVEQQTGIYIDNVIQLNFTGFQDVVNDVGGVNVCLPFAIDNTITASGGSGLNLSAGEHHIDGKVALEFWRTREDVANGSDIARIARDQYLLAQLVKGVLHSGLLTSPTEMYKVLGDLASNMTTDASDTDLLHIAESLRGLSTSKVQFITAPWASYPANPNEVEFAQPQADALFFAIAHDTALPRVRRGRARRVPATGGQPETVSPAKVRVMVLNGSAGTDETAAAAAALTSRGFTVIGTGLAAATGYVRTVIMYGSAAGLAAADTVGAEFISARLERSPTVPAGTVEVILGSSFRRLAPPKPTSAASISGLSTSYGGITASVSCRNSAFYGYYDTAPAGARKCAC